MGCYPKSQVYYIIQSTLLSTLPSGERLHFAMENGPVEIVSFPSRKRQIRDDFPIEIAIVYIEIVDLSIAFCSPSPGRVKLSKRCTTPNA